ncbi:MAG: TonB-dependent receptor [Bacteroidota bacterium]
MLLKNFLGTCGLALFCCLPLLAQEAEVHGTITDAEGTPLIGATVKVVGSVIGTTSDLDGHYTLEVPPGRIRMLYTYLGYENYDTTFRVRPDEREIEIDVVLQDKFTDIGEIVVFGRRATGQAQALRNQQSALTAQTIVHSEVFNKYPDLTMAETVSRMPGVSIVRDVNGGEIVQVRGLPEQYTAVSLNGQRLPTIQPEADQSGSLDIIQSNLVDEVRVIRARSADMDGDAIGGTVDFRIRQPEDKFEVLAQAGVGQNFGFDENPGQSTGITQLAAVLNSELSDEKVYALAAGTYFREGRGNRNQLLDYRNPGNPSLITAARPFDVDHLTERVGFVGAVELRPSIYNRMRLSFSHSAVDEEVVHRQLFAENFPDETQLARITSKWRLRRRLSLVALEVENNFPRSRLDYQLSFSVNQEDILDRVRHVFTNGRGLRPFDPERLGELIPTSTVSGREMNGITRLQDNNVLEEDLAIGSLNYTRYLTPRKNSFLRIGGRYRSKDRLYAAFNPVLPGGPEEPDVISPGTFAPVPTTTITEVPDLETEALVYQLKQRIAAGYLMFAANFTSNFSASGGLRYEYLEIENAEVDQIDSVRFDNNFVLPSLNLTYRFNRERQLRFSYYQAVARPNYATFRSNNPVALPGIDQFSIGNSDIATTTSNNLDLTFERYGRRDGLITVGLYAKFLRAPSVRITNTVFSRLRPTYETILINTESANLAGFEFGFFQNLGFLGGDFRYFNLNGNYNFNALSARSSELNFDSFTLPQAPRQTANLSIVCSNPNKGLSVVLAANYRDRIFDRVLDGRPLYRNGLFTLDLAADYQIIKDISLYLRANNLTDRPYEEWFGEPNDTDAVLRSRTRFGAWGVVGVRYRPG